MAQSNRIVKSHEGTIKNLTEYSYFKLSQLQFIDFKVVHINLWISFGSYPKINDNMRLAQLSRVLLSKS